MDFNGSVDLTGHELGTLLLDPDAIEIVAGSADPGEFGDDIVDFADNAGTGTSTIGADLISGRLSSNANVTLQANNTIDVNAAITSSGDGDLSLETGTGGTITVAQAIDVNTGNLTLKADEIDINAALSGTGDITMTSATDTLKIEVGSTDAAALNLTATELGNLQNGWSTITIGGTDHEGPTKVNEAISFADHTYFRNNMAYGADKSLDINADMTTTDNADLYLYGRGYSTATHSYDGIHINSSVDLNIARDLYLQSGSGSADAVLAANTTTVGRNLTISAGNNSDIYGTVTIGGDLTLDYNTSNSAYRFAFNNGSMVDVTGDVIFNGSNSGSYTMWANSVLEADGDISITASAINLNSTAQIRSGSGTSALTFLETGQNAMMELGGTSQGAVWQMESSEISALQDGFASITFGSSSHTGNIYFSDDVSFSDDVIFRQDQTNATSGIAGDTQIAITTTDGADASFYGKSNSVLTSTSFNIAGDVLWDNFQRVMLTESTIGGNLTVDVSGGFGLHSGQTVNVGGDLNADIDGEFIMGYSNKSHIRADGDINIESRQINLYTGSTISGNADGSSSLVFLEAGQDADMEIGGTSQGYTWEMDADEFAAIQDGFDSVVFGERGQTGDIYLSNLNASSLSSDISIYGATTTLNGATFGSGDVTLIADEIDISGSLSGTGTLQMTSADNTQTIEVGSTDAAALNLTASELSNLQNGWSNIIFGGGTDHRGLIQVNEAVSFSDNVSFENALILGANRPVDINASITTTDNADLTLRGTSTPTSTHPYDGVHISADLDIAGSLYGYAYSDFEFTGGVDITVGGNVDIDSWNTIGLGANFDVGGDIAFTSNNGGYIRLYNYRSLTAGGDITFDAANHFETYLNSTMRADGDITITSQTVRLDTDSRIFGNSDGTSTLTFLEQGNDRAMEIGGTAQGHNWQMEAHEFATIQDGFDSIVFGSSSQTGNIYLSGLDASGLSADIALYGGAIDLGNITLGTGNFLAHAQNDEDLNTIGDITKSVAGSSNLTLRADGSINSAGNDITTSNGALSVILNADRDADQSGYIAFKNATMTTRGGDIVMGGGLDPTTGFAYGISGDVNNDNGVSIANSATLNAGGGDIIIRGRGMDEADNSNSGIVIVADIITSGDGTITIEGIAGDGVDNNTGVQLSSNSLVQVENGDITITGQGNGSGSNNHGVALSGGTDIQALGTANITVTGTSSAHASQNSDGLRLSGAGVTLTSVDGDITLTGTALSNVNSDDGVLIHNQAEVSSSGSGNITLDGTVSGSSMAVRLLQDAVLAQTGSGSISISGSGSFNNNVLVNDSSAITTSNGDITVTSDTLGITADSSITSAGDLTITPDNAATTISLGVDAGAGKLDITDTELSRLSAGGSLIIGDSTNGTGAVDVDSWDLSGTSYDVALYGGAIDLGGVTLGTGDFLAHAQNDQDLTVTAAISKAVAGASTLDLRADRAVISDGYDITTSNGALSSVFNADRDADQSGYIFVDSANITTGGGDITLGGGLDPTTGFAYGISGKGALDNGVSLTSNSIFNAGGGDIIIRGNGMDENDDANVGVVIASQVRTSGTGTITIEGRGGQGDDTNYGVQLSQYGLVETENGTLTITGTGGGTGTVNHGLFASGGSDIQSTGTGDILLTGYSSSNATENSDGVRVESAGTTISSLNGDIRLTGQALTNYNNDDGVLLYNQATVTSSGSGTITLDGSAGTEGLGVHILANVNLTQTGTGAISLTGSGSTANNFVFQDNTNISTANNDITFNGDTFIITSNSTVSSAGDLIITPENNGTSIGLGGGVGTLNLADAELLRLSAGGNLIIGDSTNGTGAVDVDSWDLSGTSYDVALYGGAIDLGGITLGAGDFLAHAQNDQDLAITAAISKAVAGTSTLDLRADQSITNTGMDITTSDGALDVILNADRDADQAGYILLAGAGIVTQGGDITLGGGADPATGFAYGLSGDGVTDNGVSLSGSDTLNAGGGNITIRGHGTDEADNTNVGVSVTANLITTGSGSITIDGTAGNGTYNNVGTKVYNGAALRSENGNITLSGQGQGNGANNHGIAVESNSVIETTGTGSIVFNGTGAATGNDNADGIRIDSSNINSANGDIRLTGISLANTIKDDGILIYNNSTITSSGSGDIILDGTSATDGIAVRLLAQSSLQATGSGVITLDGSGSVDNNLVLENQSTISSTNSNITLTGDSLSMDTTSSISSGSDLIIKPENNAASIGLGDGVGTLSLTSDALARLNASGAVIIGDSVNGTGTVTLGATDISAQTYDLALYGDDVNVTGTFDAGSSLLLHANNDITLGDGVSATGADTSIVMIAGNHFTNNAGNNAIDAGAGRFLIYLDAPSDATKGGLNTPNLYNRTYGANAPSSIASSYGSRFVYAHQPTLTFTPNDITLPTPNPNFSDFTYSISGLRNGDDLSEIFSGAPTFTKTAQAAGAYNIYIHQGTVVNSDLGYALVFSPAAATLGNEGLSSTILQQTDLSHTAPKKAPTQKTSTLKDTASGNAPQSTFNDVASDNVIKIEDSIIELFGLCTNRDNCG